MPLFIGVKARRVKMDNQDGTASIPALTYNAEQLSTLTTLKEVREKWMSYKGMATVPTTTTTTFGGLFGLGKTTGFTPVLLKKKRTRSARSKKPSVKRTTAAKKKTQRGSVRVHRRSTRLALNITNKAEEEVSIDDEAMEVSDSLHPIC
jgi:hypothetical protein